jgi:hypothetical protein
MVCTGTYVATNTQTTSRAYLHEGCQQVTVQACHQALALLPACQYKVAPRYTYTTCWISRHPNAAT